MAGFFIMRLMLDDAMIRLRISGFSVFALALRVKYSDLLDLSSVTVFTLDEDAIFAGSDLRLHVVPNRRLMAVDLENLLGATPTVVPRMEWERSLAGPPRAARPFGADEAQLPEGHDPRFDFTTSRSLCMGVSLPFQRVIQTAAVELAKIRLRI